MKSNLIIGLLFLLSIQLSGQEKWYKYPGNPVFPWGKPGEWDQAKIAQSVLFEDDQYHMWYIGFSDLIPGFRGIGYAFSTDGIHWQKYENNPLIFKQEEASWDSILFNFDLIKKDSLYCMWYTGVDKKTIKSCVGFAMSDDGITWTRHPEPVIIPGTKDDWDASGIRGTKVYFTGTRFLMWYNAYDGNWIESIGFATSVDGINWEKYPANPVLETGEPGSWDGYWIEIYSVNFNGSFYEMWYDASDKINNQVGYATSVDGINWIKSPDNPVLQVGELGNWDTWIARKPIVVCHDSVYKMWYYGHAYSRGNIGYATSSPDEAQSWDTATIDKPQKKFKVQLFNRIEYINVDSLSELLPELSGTGLINAMNKLALAYSLNDGNKSLGFAKKTIELSYKEKYPAGRAMALYTIGNSYYVQDNYSDALKSYLSALWLFDSLDMQFELGNLLSQIASIHSYASSHELACNYYKKALDVFESLNDTGFIIQSLLYYGHSSLVYGDTSSAIEAFQRSILLAKVIQLEWKLGESYEGMGLCYSGHYLDSALYYFNEANKIWNHAWPEKYNLLITAEAYIAAGPEYYNDAENIFFRCFKLLADGKYQKVRLYLDAAELYFVTGRYRASKEFLDIALDECLLLIDRQDYTMYAFLEEKLMVELDLKKYMEKIYRLYFRLDTVFHDKDLALKHYMLATLWKDSIVNQQNKMQWAMLQGQYETETAQNQIALLKKENEVKNLTLLKSRIFLFATGALVLLIFFGALIFIRNRRIKAQHAIEFERVKSEKLLELDRLKSKFFANISHEFRTPLTLIKGPLERILSEAENIEYKKDIATAFKYTGKLQALINNLLSISKLESGKMQLHASETNIVNHVRSYLQSFESLAEQRKIKLQFASDSSEIKAFIDAEKFEQVLNNLLSNAFKFTPESGTIEVKITKIPSANDVLISVADNGIGISSKHINYIFDRFYQEGNDDTKHFEGSGIGLALTKELVELHKGQISVESNEGEGSTFIILLPLGREHLKDEQIRSLPPDEKESLYVLPDTPDDNRIQVTESLLNKEDNDTRKILLIVEDHFDMRAHIRMFFEDEFQIIEAADGAEGYERSTQHIPDIIISDVMMPNMDGHEFCRKIKTDERTSHIPLILLTARASRETRIEGLETGADDFITKPFDGIELQIRVKNLIDQRDRIKNVLGQKIHTISNLVQLSFSDSGITSMDERFIQKVIEVVAEQYSDPEFNTGALGLSVGLGKIQLNRKMKALTGQTTVAFIRNFRLNRAAELIKAKSATIAEIAYDVGFNNPSYFTECFQAYFGKPPSEFNTRE